MADIVVTTDFSQVKDLNNTLNSTGDIFNKVVDRLLREQRRAERVTKAFSETTEASLDLLAKAEAIVTQILEAQAAKREKVRQKEAERAEKEVQRQIDANNKLIASEVKRRAKEEEVARTSAQNFQAQVGPNLGLGARGISAGASADAFEAQIERLRQKYDTVYASSQLYESSLKELNQAHMLGAINTKQHETAVESLNAEYQAFQNGVAQAGNRFAQHVNQTSTGMNKFGVAAQQTGYQFSDFIVQVQSGTNPLVAFSQQATQMAGLLYLLPPAMQAARVGFGAFSVSMATATAGLTILIPLLAMLAMSFFNSGEEAKEAADGPLKEAENRIKSLDSTLKDFLNTRKAASMGITVDELISQDALTEAQKQLAEAEAAYKKISGSRASRGIGAVEGIKPSDDPDLVAAQRRRYEAAERLRLIEERMRDLYREQSDELTEAQALEIARLKYGENSLEFKQAQADVDRRAYEQQIRGQQLNETFISQLMSQYDFQQSILKTQESQTIATENQRASENARAKERLANEQAYQAALDKTLAKNQYWSDQAKAAERQAAAVDYIVNNLSLLAAKKDAEGFNKAMEDALAAGTQFSLVDLSSIVAMAARNGWDLAAALTAAYNAAASRNPVGASVLIGAGGRPDINPNDMQFRGPVQEAQANILQYNRDKIEEAKKGGGKEDALTQLREQLALETELIGTSEAYQRVRRALGEDFATTSPKIVENLVQQIESNKELIQLEEQRQRLMDQVGSSLENGFMAMIEGTKSVKDAFKQMAYEIIKELYRVLVVQQMVGSFDAQTKQGTGIVGFLGKLLKRESGGTMMPGRPYLVGERGPELVIPRHSGTVVNANQTANAVGGSGTTVVNNNISVTGSDAAMVRAEVAKMIPQITNATKAAVIDARLRGGQMKAAFG